MLMVYDIFSQSWQILIESAVYILFGLLISGLLKVVLSPESVARHLGGGRMSSVFKAALIGIPLPLCSCGVVPAAVSLKKQGAGRGATTAFLISTPESGVDSIAVTYALMDPIMTVARPVAAFVMAVVAGVAEMLFDRRPEERPVGPRLTGPPDHCCSDTGCSVRKGLPRDGLKENIGSGIRYALTEVWGDLAGWFWIGLVLAGIITVIVPDEILTRHLGGGVSAMVLMLIAGIPVYICATASTPIAAALVLKGVSPGAALVFLLAGPATNIASLTLIAGVLGRRATLIYLGTISCLAIVAGLIVDQVYSMFGFSARFTTDGAGEWMPEWVALCGAVFLIILSVRPIWTGLRSRFSGSRRDAGCDRTEKNWHRAGHRRPAATGAELRVCLKIRRIPKTCRKGDMTNRYEVKGGR